MLKELTSRGILFICLLKGRSCTYLDAKNDIKLKKISIPPFQYSTISVVHHSSSPFHRLYTSGTSYVV